MIKIIKSLNKFQYLKKKKPNYKQYICLKPLQHVLFIHSILMGKDSWE